MNFNNTAKVPTELINQIRNLLVQHGCLTWGQAQELSTKRILIIACLDLLPNGSQTKWLGRLDNKQHLLAQLVNHQSTASTPENIKAYLKGLQKDQHAVNDQLIHVNRANQLFNRKLDGLSSLFN